MAPPALQTDADRGQPLAGEGWLGGSVTASEIAGEARANLLRIVGIGSFYIIELCNFYGVHLGPLELDKIVDDKFHQSVTAVAVAWVLLALATHVALVRGLWFPALKFMTTTGDLILLTTILMIADGPRSPLVVGYFLIVVLSGLRLRLSLVRWCTIGSVLAYLVLLGYAKWFAVDRQITVPRYQELIILLALALTGVILGQIIRRVNDLSGVGAHRLTATE